MMPARLLRMKSGLCHFRIRRGFAAILAVCALALALGGSAHAQAGTGRQPPPPTSVRIQVFDPSGAPLAMQIRLELICDEPNRPPEYHYTDSSGRAIISGIIIGLGYTVIAESDGKNWGRTDERMIALGPRFTFQLHLRPHETVTTKQKTVSVNTLQQDVPRAARKEYEAGVELATEGESDRARASFEKAIETFPNYVDARNELAVHLMRAGRLADAEAQLRRALETDGTAVRPLLNLGLCLYRQQRYADALPFLEKAVSLDPENVMGTQLLGIALVMSGDLARAEPVLQRAYSLGGKRAARSQFYLSHLYTRQKKYPNAAVALETYLRDAPDDPNAESLRATLVKLRAASQP